MTQRPGRIARTIMFGALATLVVGGCTGGFAPQGSPGATDTGALGCQIAPPPGMIVRTGDPRASGQPMAGVDVTVMTPRQVGELARSRGLKVTWRYEYGITAAVGPGGLPLAGSTPGLTPVAAGSATPVASDTAPEGSTSSALPSVALSPSGAASPKPGGVAAGIGGTGFSECWCEPPPDGRVTTLAYGMASELVVFVDSGRTLPAPRSQPSRGWGC